MVATGLAGSLLGGRLSLRQSARQHSRAAFRAQPVRAAAQAAADEQLGFKMMRQGIKEAGQETVLTPRFYTTDFDEMEVQLCISLCSYSLRPSGLNRSQCSAKNTCLRPPPCQQELFSLEKNPNLVMEEFDAMLSEFRTDYNQTHFVRNETFKKAADNITGPARKIFIEFLERSCTAEFSGFLLYKELGRRLKETNPVGEPFWRFYLLQISPAQALQSTALQAFPGLLLVSEHYPVHFPRRTLLQPALQ